jgi:hypothetical protein
MNQVLIDIEALGQKPGCAIFELAAVRFDLASGEISSEFLALIEPDNGWVCPETEDWHREKGTYPMPGTAARVGISKALRDFAMWFAGLGPVESVWAWGATYDFPVLESRWRDWGPSEGLPWEYYQAECARTVWRRAFGPDVRHGDRPHQALEDCRAAVADLVKAMNKLSPETAGTVHPPAAMILRNDVGSLKGEGTQWDLSTVFGSNCPVIHSKQTGNWFILSWQEVLALAIEAGIELPVEGAEGRESASADGKEGA